MPDTIRPSEAALQEWITLVANALPQDTYEVPNERSRDFQLLYGPCMQASRFSASFVGLHVSDFSHEAGVLARAAFEHAVTAHWVYFTSGGLDRFASALVADAAAYRDDLDDYLGNMRPTDREFAAIKGKGLPPFGQMMWDLDSHSYLRTTYRSLSLRVHPTHAAVAGYLVHTDEGTELRHRPEGSAELFPALYSCAISSMLAYALVRHIIDPMTAPSLVEEASVALRLPPFLDDALPSEKRRFPDRWSVREPSAVSRRAQ
ncbi:hypothetical protein JOF42_000348 [Microbacterium phyllosphaerae]|uniref:Uncharacterized protein n=1 Tax=Microbacterium phyllosphaerae TaxID=124798 RepID=A0ABS4WLN2_9MICO|nr:hypothetical protein [Microbacterium phyllosphaerae]MBP2376853.1 hypothetical protein [Microbacterium phyllosphaerae]